MKVHIILNSSAREVVEADSDLESWLNEFSSQLQRELDPVVPSLNAKSLNEAVVKVSSRYQVSHKPQIDPYFPPNVPDASNRLDLLFRPLEIPRWRIGLEVCTDNRQAITMNLFKLELMNRNWPKDVVQGHSAIGFALTIAKAVRNSRWDGAVGTAEDYELALLRTYSNDLTSPIGLFVLDF